MTDNYTPEEEALLLELARTALEALTTRRDPPALDLDALPESLRAERACFVTLRHREDGALRGCTGTLVARRSLAEEVVYMAGQTAFHDPRFPPVEAHEIAGLHIDISVLTPSQPLDFEDPDDLLARLRPGVDGVTLMLGSRRSTFLPQVWDSYPDPKIFLDLLCQKMGMPPDAWRTAPIQVETYQAIMIEEAL
jgi:AmmeMemoRadiSam system protein A